MYIIFIVSFLIYLSTLAPTIIFSDAPELVSTGFGLGIAHPPGYSLYLILLKLSSFIPLGSLAWKGNILSALFGSLTVVGVYLLIKEVLAILYSEKREKPVDPEIDERRARILVHSLATASSLLFAFSNNFWDYALGSEVYTLNSFIFCLVLFFILREARFAMGFFESSRGDEKRYRNLVFLSFTVGVFIAFHSANLIYVPLFCFIVLYLNWKSMPLQRSLVPCLFFLILAVSVILYLPIRSEIDGVIKIGEAGNWKGFYNTLTGKVYATGIPLLSISLKERLFNFQYAFTSIRFEYQIFFIILGLFGLWVLSRRVPLLSLFFILLILLNASLYSNFDLGAKENTTFPFQLFFNYYILFSVLIAVGLKTIIEILISFNPLKFLSRTPHWLLSLSLIPLSPLYQNYHINNASEYYSFHDFGKNVLGFLEQGSSFLTTNKENLLFYFLYFQSIEGRWPDVKVLMINPFIRAPLVKLIKNPEHRKALQILKNKHFHNQGLGIIDALIKNHIDNGPFFANIQREYISDEYIKVPKGYIFKVQTEAKDFIVKYPKILYKTRVSYDDKLEFVGYNMDKTIISRGEPLQITYFWRTLRQLEKNHKIIVIITDRSGRVLRELYNHPLSHYPVYGSYPTSQWKESEIVKDEGYFMPHFNIVPGDYYINIGISDGKELLPIIQNQTTTDGRFARLEKVTVNP
ncbi:MAG: hypothetical protein FD151_408 [bacterium]|nr:MAG: hypothetical protein FD151_408 [bacterium]